MTRIEFEEKLAKIQDVDGLVAAVRGETDEEKILAAFRSYGLELTEEDLKDISFDGEELDLDQLDAVAGGCSCGGWLQHAVWTVLNWATGRRLSKHVGGDT